MCELIIDRACESNIKELLNLYYQAYGKDYPLAIGSDREFMRKAILSNGEYLWVVGKDKKENNKIVGSAIFQLDQDSRIGKVMGVAVSLGYRGKGVAAKLIEFGTVQLLEKEDLIYALYTTTRTLSVSSQIMFLKNGYYPLGIFPNAHKIHFFESLTFMGKFRKGILEKRNYVSVISTKLKPLLKISNKVLGKKSATKIKKNESIHMKYELEKSSIDSEYEFIHAPEFVRRRYEKLIPKDRRKTYCSPFEIPNFLIASKKTDFELYAYISQKDYYCAIIAFNKGIENFGKGLKGLLFRLKDLGVSYIEVLLRLDQDLAIEYFLNNQFLPSALCPAFKEKNGRYYDFIFLSRTMQPLDFTGMKIDATFKPYVDQYIKQWIDMHVASLEVVKLDS